MADISKAKDFNFTNMVSNWLGYVSSFDKTNLAPNIMVRPSQNIYKKLSGTLAVRQGQKRRGVANSTQSSISSSFVWNTSWGGTITMAISNSTLYAILDDVWYVLQSNITSTRYVFDKWWNNTAKRDKLLFVNGTDNLYAWSGATATILSSTSGTITKTGTTTWATEGFSATTGTVMINGVTTVYTGGATTTTISGVSPDPTSQANGSLVLEAVVTTLVTPTTSFLSGFIKVINNQAYIGSYTSRLIYISKNTDYLDYVVPTPTISGSPELITLDGVGQGIGVRQGTAYVGFGEGSWASIVFTDITVGSTLTRKTTVDVKPVAIGQAPYAHEFIDTVGDNIIYLAQDQQVRYLGSANTSFTTVYPSLSQEVATELSEENFEGGSLTCIGEFVYLSAPASGNVYLRQERNRLDQNGAVVGERLWHSPFVWNLSAVRDLDGDTVGFSNANPQIYDLWDTDQWFDDSPSDEELPYECILALSYRGESRRQGLWNFNKLYTEGYITTGTELNATINYNYKGALTTTMFPINSVARPATIFSLSPDSLGDEPLGENPLGDGMTDPDDTGQLDKFKNINSLGLINCFEWQPIYSSDTVNAQWEILAEATNASVDPLQDATFLINKL